MNYILLVGVGVVETMAVTMLPIKSTLISGILQAALLSSTFVAYTEYSIGGIVLRGRNRRIILPTGVLPVIIWPLYDKTAWQMKYWDINIYALAVGLCIAKYLQ